MAIYVNTNVSSLNSQRQLANATNSLNTTYQHLASGLRINSAKDDAAGLQISDRLTSQINGLSQGNRNANDGIALAQTAEGAMDEMTSMIQRIRTLALQAANGSNTDADRQSIQKEVTALADEISRISEKTTFNGEKILAGRGSDSSLLDKDGNIHFQVGSYAYDTLSVNLGKGFSTAQIATSALEKSGVNIELEIVNPNTPPYDAMTDAEILEQGKIPNDIVTTIVKGSESGDTNIQTDGTNASASAFVQANGAAFVDGTNNQFDVGDKVYITSANIGEFIAAASKSGTDAGADSANNARLVLTNVLGLNVYDVGISATDDATTDENQTLQRLSYSVSTIEQSQLTLSYIDSYLLEIDSARADLGAIQNRMESTIRNQSNIYENTSDARSRIRDTDFAEETANLTAQSIIQQTSQSILTQANQRPQIALALLTGGQ